MDIHVHVVSIGQVWDYLNQHKGAIVLAWLAAIKILTAVQDAIDVMPSGLKPPFGKLIYLMKATIPYLGWGNRIKPISDTPVTITTTAAPSAAKTIPVILLFISLVGFTGCSSAVLKTGCGHLTGTEITVPYVGGKASGNAYGCYMGCVGMGCKEPDYSALASVMTEYTKDASKDNTIKTTDGGTVTYIPPSK